MYAGITMVTNSEYAELVIKANKYDILRADVLDSSYISITDRQLFGITDEEIQAHKEKENK